MKLSRVVLAALVALPLAGAVRAAGDTAGQPDIERLLPGEEAAPAGALPEAALPMPAIPSGAAPEPAAAPGDGQEPPAAAANGDDGTGSQEPGAGRVDGDGGAQEPGEGKAAGDAPAQDEDPAIERAKVEAVDTPAPPAPQEEPAQSRI